MSDSYPGDPDVDYTEPSPTENGPVAQTVADQAADSGGYAPPPLKPGYATTEFWLTLAGSVVGILVGLGVVGPDFAKQHEQLVNAIAMLAAIVAPGMYAVARGIVKHGHQQAVARVLSAKADTGATALGVILAVLVIAFAIWLGVAIHPLWLLLLLVVILCLLL